MCPHFEQRQYCAYGIVNVGVTSSLVPHFSHFRESPDGGTGFVVVMGTRGLYHAANRARTAPTGRARNQQLATSVPATARLHVWACPTHDRSRHTSTRSRHRAESSGRRAHCDIADMAHMLALREVQEPRRASREFGRARSEIRQTAARRAAHSRQSDEQHRCQFHCRRFRHDPCARYAVSADFLTG